MILGIAPRSSRRDARAAAFAEVAATRERFGPSSSEYRASCTVKLLAQILTKELGTTVFQCTLRIGALEQSAVLTCLRELVR